MKNLLVLLLSIFFGYQSNAQSFTKEWFDAFESDDVEFVNSNINVDNVDECFMVKGSPYNLLSVAIKLDAKEIFNSLIEKNANLNKVCSAKTPAMYAVKYGKFRMLKTLVEKGADLTLENDGKTVLDYARNYSKVKIERYLLSLDN